MAESTVRRKKFGSDHGLIHEAVVTGLRAGADEAFWAALAHDKGLELWPRVMALVQGTEQTESANSCTLAEAAQIMVNNFHGPAAVTKHLGIKLGRSKQWQTVPFSSNELQAVADTHVLVAAPAVSIMDIHAVASHAFYSDRDPWYGESRQTFAHEKCQPGWYLVSVDEVPGSTNKRWDDQRDMVQQPDFVPVANVAAYAWVLHYMATGERMFARVWVRTDSVTADGSRVYLSGRVSGLGIYYWIDSAFSNIGVVSARKSS